jgi:uncharacterized protein (TIRG00374 family)
MASLLRWRPLAAATLLSALSWSMEVLAFLMILEALEGQGVTLLGSAFIFSITTILGAISFLPGGLGVAEGSMIGALLLHGVFTVEARAATATYLIRFATLWFGVVVGFLALLVFRYRHGDVDLDRESLDDEPPDVRRGEGASRDPNGG